MQENLALCVSQNIQAVTSQQLTQEALEIPKKTQKNAGNCLLHYASEFYGPL